MDKVVKQLRITTAGVLGRPDHTDVRLTYGRSGDLGVVRLHADDFSDFIEALRNGFPIVIVQTPARKMEEDD